MFFIFHMKCNAVWIHCAQITRERETNENEAIVLRFGATVQQKDNGVRSHSDGFQQSSAHGTLQCANIRPFRPPPKAPWLNLFHGCHYIPLGQEILGGVSGSFRKIWKSTETLRM